ncbi:Multicopper oxidase with three cupredoxin domains (includes cell division protein FtsP and spore coat protein CotA) [Tranquillimonas rosea]|uniref:Multicopper oxidase with three cupredoxin domains (Includes cell division protein FtsP and spore coat protein CotA) n=2 Tax=Rhodobacterales TaxID=204455 RepID=A0A1H9TA58_9RHOB|nr:FtsP/CotA-like multicopper oxidase with cupredoxin domain [Allosediminivita pacifica]SER93927.1 Multicopper oxidase with three cupredoxin domains (includes cell division protein FtsP and spore coat protein CotA) [Tranquillimonas rosea]
MPTRRAFIGQTAAVMGLAVSGRQVSAASHAPATLTARDATAQLAPDGYAPTSIWGYEGRAPGPAIRVHQGERVRRRLVNGLLEPTSVHWHGIRIDNAMDGVSGLTQEAVAPGQAFVYDFVAPDAGTYWYHAHNRSWVQVARGLHGPLIVEEAEPPEVDREETLVLDDWLLDPETAMIEDSFDQPMRMSHGGRIGNLITTNGRFDLSIPVARHMRLRLRLINASNARIFPLQLTGMRGWTVALDGMPLAAPEPLEDVLVLAPAQRADLIVDVTTEAGEIAHLVRIGNNDQPASQVAFPVSGSTAQTPRTIPAALPPNPGDDLGALADAQPLRLVMSGGAMGRMDSAFLGGERLGFRELAARGRFWAFNEMAEMTQAPLADLSLGEPVRLEIVNETAFPHAMHLHGMHFREIRDGEPVGPMRDTLMVAVQETREIGFIADNAGDWLFHCHMLSHAESGMMTWVRVT